jgi:RimJ/RimL family protein N-acetyltransferase
MSINTQLFQGQHIRLGQINYEKDPAIESGWTHNSKYLHSLGPQIGRPLSAAGIKKRYEAIEKEMDESKNLFYFTIRSQEDDRLLGFARLFWIEWSNGSGGIQIAIGNPDERDQPYAREALQLVLNYAFRELNLYRLSALASEDDPLGIDLLKSAGFVEEVRRRQAIRRNGSTLDLLLMGLLNSESREPGVESLEDNQAKVTTTQRATHRSPISKNLSALTTEDLFSGQQTRLTAEDPEIMAKAFARWNLDSEYLRLLDSDPPRLWSEKQFKDWFEKELEKNDPNDFFFMIRPLDDEQPIGFTGLFDLHWNHGDALVAIALGDRTYWGNGYGTDAMRILLRYAFIELNLRRVTLIVFDYNPRARRSYEKCGFVHEGTVRGVLQREGRRWDWHFMGILRQEWEQTAQR